jgi:hypothetical protein
MHHGLAGLLHFVRNDGKGVVNYGSINNDLSGLNNFLVSQPAI